LDITSRLTAMQNQNEGKKAQPARSIIIIIKDPEQEVEIILWVWATIILTYKLGQVGRERALLKHDFVGARQGERVIPDDALDRYKELKSAVEAEPRWQDRLLPEFLLAALHRFYATRSVQDAASAIKERAELIADNLDSELSLLRYVAWAIPAVGFIGTVRGIGDALSHADEAIKGDLSGVTSSLGLAFNSTLVALILSMVLMYMLHMLQSRQEALILELQNYCRDKLVDIMKVPETEQASVHSV
jgi:biopolymer transport protein ExbB/TolQ